MRLSYSESDTENTPLIDPAMTRAAAGHIDHQDQAVGWEDPDKTRLVPVAQPSPSSLSARTGSSELVDAAAETDEDEKKTFLGLNPPQIVGGALASATAAGVGAQLGVAGTIAGAALTSVVIAVGGAAYTTSISRTSSRLGAVASRVRLDGTAPPLRGVSNAADSSGPSVTTSDAATSAAHITDATTIRSRRIGAATPVVGDSGGGESQAKRSWRDRFSPFHVLATAAAVFLLAVVVVTGLETLRGESFSGNGQTTVGQIGREAGGGSTNGSGKTGPADPDTDRDAPRGEATAPATTPAPAKSQTPAPTSRATSSSTPTSAATSSGRADTQTRPNTSSDAPNSGDASGTSGTSGRSSTDNGTTNGG